MEEAQALCDEIAIMDYGRIIARGSPVELIKRHCGGVTVELPMTSFNPSLPPLSIPFQVVQDRIEMMTDDLNGFVAELVAKNVNLKDMAVRSPNLEDVFLTLTGRQLRE
jgi:ABC-2 type transport system ATP-binding protein